MAQAPLPSIRGAANELEPSVSVPLLAPFFLVSIQLRLNWTLARRLTQSSQLSRCSSAPTYRPHRHQQDTNLLFLYRRTVIIGDIGRGHL
jgi:hypothetical protein